MSERYEGQTFYELLEIQPQAGPGEIYNAYQRARTTYSPSSPALYSMFTPQEAQELMSLIEEAYQTLSHQGKRREYDQKLGLIDPRFKPQPERETLSIKQQMAKKKVDDPWVGPVKVVHRSKEELPKGFARTKFSVYEVKPELESEIAAITECDGKFLQKIRLYKGVTLDQMSEEIRVIKSTLVALEADDLDPLPVAVFTRGFVVQYARALILDEKKISDSYMKYFKARKVVR
ncbi:MAG: helix-turn-helix domain-containing protein [Bdellovibrionales bacterium]